MKTFERFLIMTLLAGLLAARSHAAATPAEQACEKLKAEAQQTLGEDLTCAAAGDALVIPAGAWAKLRPGMFPDGSFHGFPVRPADAAAGTSGGTARAERATIARTVEPVDTSNLVAAAVNFDNAAARTDGALAPSVLAFGSLDGAKLVKTQYGPPGSGDGPPGSGQSGPPGSAGGPPGSGDDPQQGPPGSGQGPSAPPSRPAPVWRSRFPAPPPNWWNTDWQTYEWWQSLPNDYDQPREERVSQDRILYHSGWSRWPDVFSTGWEHDTDSAQLSWRASDGAPAREQRTLASQTHRELKECYYSDVYRYDWVQGGFYGSHWEESFDHYEARCVRLPTQYGRPRVATVYVDFDFSGLGAFLPWETGVEDGVTIYYDGSNITYNLSQRLAQYKVRLDDRQPTSESWTIVAGAKRNQPPERDKVNAYLARDGGVKLVIDDQRDAFYDGETLEVSVEIKKDSGHWYSRDTVVLQRDQSGPIRVVVRKGAHPQASIDVPSQGSGKYYIKSWSFRRAQSKISTGDWIGKGGGNSVQY